MRRILITQLSPLPKDRRVTRYKVTLPSCDTDYIEAIQTNESIIKCLSHLTTVRSEGGIDLIIVLGTNTTNDNMIDSFGGITAYQYYEQIVSECGFHPKYLSLNIDRLGTTEVFNRLCLEIEKDDIVYIDSAGGLRTISNLVQIVAKMLKFLGIQNPYTLYASKQEGQESAIESTADFVRLMNLADAFNEFMTTGKSDQLKACFEGRHLSADVEKLLNAMGNFSDQIRIGSVELLDETIKELSEAIDRCIHNTSAKDDIESVILYRFLPTIEQKLLADRPKEVNYVKIINWCLDNMLIQQALTIYVEKMPVYLFDQGIITYQGEIDDLDRSNNALRSDDWQTNAFSEIVMKCPAENIPSTPLDQIIADCKSVLNGEDAGDSDGARIALDIEKFKNNPSLWTQSHFKKRRMQAIHDLIDKHKISKYERLVSFVKNGAPEWFWTQCIGEAPKANEKKISSISKKVLAIKSMMESGFQSNEISFCIETKRIAAICAGYIYVKAIRNQTNHASREENLTIADKQFLSLFGYDFSAVNIQTIQRNMKHALSQIP